jgi:hypothetical protein
MQGRRGRLWKSEEQLESSTGKDPNDVFVYEWTIPNTCVIVWSLASQNWIACASIVCVNRMIFALGFRRCQNSALGFIQDLISPLLFVFGFIMNTEESLNIEFQVYLDTKKSYVFNLLVGILMIFECIGYFSLV